MGLIGAVLLHVFWLPLPLWLLLRFVVFAGGPFGLLMAGYYRWEARKLGLPLWEDYGNARESLESEMD